MTIGKQGWHLNELFFFVVLFVIPDNLSSLTAKESRINGNSNTRGKRRILRYKLFPFKDTYITFRREEHSSIRSLAIGFRHVMRSEQSRIYKMPLMVDVLEPDCAASGPYHKRNKCNVGKRASYKTVHCLCQGDPSTPMMLQTSFFEIPKMSDVEWKEFVAGIKRNPTPVLWTLFFLIMLLLGFRIASDQGIRDHRHFRKFDQNLST